MELIGIPVPRYVNAGLFISVKASSFISLGISSLYSRGNIFMSRLTTHQLAWLHSLENCNCIAISPAGSSHYAETAFTEHVITSAGDTDYLYR